MLQSTLAIVDLALLACLGDLDILLHEADGESDVRLAVIAVIGDDGHGNGLGALGRAGAGRIHSDPVGKACHSPFA